MLTIDQYAETALGNRQFFLNKPYGVGGKNDKIPLAKYLNLFTPPSSY